MSRSITLRLPTDVYDAISHSADTLSRTKNKEIIQRLSSTMQREKVVSSLLLDGLGLDRHLRIESSTEEADTRRLFLFTESIDMDAVYLAARRDAVRGHALVVVLQSYSITYLLDHTTLNPAKPDSHALILDFLANIERLGWQDRLHLCDSVIEDTRCLSAFEAIGLVCSKTFKSVSDTDALFSLFEAR